MHVSFSMVCGGGGLNIYLVSHLLLKWKLAWNICTIYGCIAEKVKKEREKKTCVGVSVCRSMFFKISNKLKCTCQAVIYFT